MAKKKVYKGRFAEKCSLTRFIKREIGIMFISNQKDLMSGGV